MLEIRSEQMDALRNSAEDAFIAREMRRLAGVHSGTGPPPDEDWIRRRMDEAASFGIVSESDLTRYHDLARLTGDGYPSGTDKETLMRDDLWGWQKLDALESDRIFSDGHPLP